MDELQSHEPGVIEYILMHRSLPHFHVAVGKGSKRYERYFMVPLIYCFVMHSMQNNSQLNRLICNSFTRHPLGLIKKSNPEKNQKTFFDFLSPR